MNILRLAAVKERFGFKSHASIYTAIKDGNFVKQVNIGVRSVGWLSSEDDAIVMARAAGHTDTQIKALVTRLHAKRQELALALALV